MESALALLEQRIKAADPRSILSRGYSLVTDEGGVVVNSAAGLRPGQRLRILFADGTVDAQIVDTQ
jgi:exodeoxyribonuclease VII large subunit